MFGGSGAVRVGVLVAAGASVFVGPGVLVEVASGMGEMGVGEFVGVSTVGVKVIVGVMVGVRVGVAVPGGVGVPRSGVLVAVGVLVRVGVLVLVGVRNGVLVAVGPVTVTVPCMKVWMEQK